MADRRIRRIIETVFDRRTADQAEGEMVKSLGRAGEQGGKDFLQQLRGTFATRMAGLKEDLARGIIDKDEFRKRSQEAAKAFNEGLLASIQKARAEGRMTDAEYVKLTRNLKHTGDVGGTAWEKIRAGIVKAGGALAAFFAARRLLQFGRDSVNAFRELRAEFRLTEQQLSNMGVQWSAVETRVRAHARALWDTHRLTEGEVMGTFRALLVVTNDYETSLRAVGVTHDIMAQTGLGADQAARLLGRAINGNITAFNRYGIELDGTRDILEQLEERFKGAALAGTDGAISLEKAWGDFRETIGAILTQSLNLEQGTSAVADSIRRVNDALGENYEQWVRVGRVVTATGKTIVGAVQITLNGIWTVFDLVAYAVTTGLNLVNGAINEFIRGLNLIPGVNIEFRINRYPAEQFLDGMKSRNTAIADSLKGMGAAWGAAFATIEERADSATVATRKLREEVERTRAGAVDEVRLLKQGHDLRVLNNAEAARAFQLAVDTRAELQRANLTLQERIALVQRLATLESITGEREIRPNVTANGVDAPRGGGMILTPVIVPPRKGLTEFQQLLSELAGHTQATTHYMESAFSDFFSSLASGFDTTKDGFHSLAAAAQGIGASIVAGLAGGMRDYHLAKGAGKIAEGMWPVNPMALAAGAKHIAAAGLFGAIEGGMRGSGRSAGVAVPASAPGEVGRGAVDRAERKAPDIHIQVDGIDPMNPKHQNLVHDLAVSAGERHGGGNVFVNGRRR